MARAGSDPERRVMPVPGGCSDLNGRPLSDEWMVAATVGVMASTDAELVAALREVLDQALAEETGDTSRTGDGPRVYREGDPLPAAAQAALDRRDPAEVDRRWREVTGQA